MAWSTFTALSPSCVKTATQQLSTTCRLTVRKGWKGHVDLRENSDLRRKLSVECNISKDTDIPPVLIIHGTKDRTVNTIGSTDLYLKLKECGKEASYILIKGADHDGGEFTSPAVLKELDAYIKHVLA